MPRETCGSCGAPIRWATTVPGGAAMPIDKGSQHAEDGSVLVFRVMAAIPDQPQPGVFCVVLSPKFDAAKLAKLPAGAFTRYRSHYQTCPDAAQHSKRGK